MATTELSEEILSLRQQSGKPIMVGSPSLIAQLTQLRLIDEYQICVHPIILGKGLTLFKSIQDTVTLTFSKSKKFKAGPILLYYKTKK